MIISSPDREIDQQKRNQKFCTQCGNELPDQVNFCSHCGNPKIPAISEKISISYKCPLCRNPLSTLKIPSDDGEAFKSGWICQVCNAKFDRDLNLLRDPKKESSSYNSGKSLDFMYIVKISGGLLVILLIVLTMAGTAKSGSNLLYGIVFLILSGGIFYEGWKAVKP
jgi:predicted RNA-binding Zn-ribbon protein involved in translation (DUF1610 family)